MSWRPVLFLATALLAAANLATAASMIATTEDGLKVLLRDNGTWIPFDEAQRQSAGRAVLTLEQRTDLPAGCRLGLRMQNDLPAPIRSLVVRFTAYKDDIPFETVSRGYSSIKPTMSQYQEVAFRGIACGEISAVEVFAARNCHVGDLTKYSASANDCLQLITVTPSELMPLARRQPR
jgi:hypothetical protein